MDVLELKEIILGLFIPEYQKFFLVSIVITVLKINSDIRQTTILPDQTNQSISRIQLSMLLEIVARQSTC